ncbi:MAG: hypothetical protein ACM3US_08040 [Sphingomonadaceae bacterium]
MRVLPLVFAAVLVWVVGSGLWYAANGSSGPVLQSFGSYRLTQATTGQEAVAQMSRLHGKGVGVTGGYVGHYEGPSGGAMAYVGETAGEGDARTLLAQMERLIAAGNPYFTDLKPLTIDGVRVLSVRSGQEAHYFWQAGNKVVWIGFDQEDPAGISAAVQAFR